jgi:L-iditol 2-dehydrogenase
MKALVLTKYNNFEIKEVQKPQIKGNEVLVRVKAVGICGSDVHGMDGSTGRRQPPVIMGHEASGVIEEVGSTVKNWNTGERVTFDSTIYPLDDWYSRKGLYNLSNNRMVIGVSCNDYKRDGAFAEYLAVPEHILYKLPENVSFEYAATVEPIAVALHSVNLTTISINDTALVGGTGMIALFIIQLLKLAGCGKIITFDIDQSKLDLALKLGATHAFKGDKVNVAEEVNKITGNRGADIGFEVVGISFVLRSVIESVRKGGNVTLVGNISAVVEMPLQLVVTRQLKLQGSCAICGEYETVLNLISQGQIQIDPMISAVAPLEEGPEWFKRLYNKEPGLMKVLLKP